MRAIQAHPRLTLQPVVTGMHLDARFGLTVREVEANWKIAARVVMHAEDERPSAMARSVGLGVTGLSEALDRLKPDIVVVLGDRTEAFAAATAAVLSRRVLVHIHGGDVSKGGYDEYMRHAITKLAHVHFAATQRSAERILKMGERKEYVYVVGAPGLDSILHSPRMAPSQAAEHVRMDLNQPYALLIQHPVSTSPETATEEIDATLRALRRIDIPVVAIYPNSDPGAASIVRALRDEASAYPRLVLARSLPREIFLTVLSEASVLLGNSSAGVIESTSFNLPAINIGPRQEGRERGDNVLNVPHNAEAILGALQRALQDEAFLKKARKAQSPYGDGHASERIAECLAELEIVPDLFVKQLTFDSKHRVASITKKK